MIIHHLQQKKIYQSILKSKGISKVLLTAPGKGIPNIVYGINSKNNDIESNNIFQHHVQQIVLRQYYMLLKKNMELKMDI